MLPVVLCARNQNVSRALTNVGRVFHGAKNMTNQNPRNPNQDQQSNQPKPGQQQQGGNPKPGQQQPGQGGQQGGGQQGGQQNQR
jgi:hypothetical protein